MTAPRFTKQATDVMIMLFTALVVSMIWLAVAAWTLNGPPSALDTHTHNEHCSPEAHQ